MNYRAWAVGGLQCPFWHLVHKYYIFENTGICKFMILILVKKILNTGSQYPIYFILISYKKKFMITNRFSFLCLQLPAGVKINFLKFRWVLVVAVYCLLIFQRFFKIWICLPLISPCILGILSAHNKETTVVKQTTKKMTRIIYFKEAKQYNHKL